MARKEISRTEVLDVGHGLWLGVPQHALPAGALVDCLNVRISRSKITSFLMGWEAFTRQDLGGPCTLIDQFFRTDGTQEVIAGTFTDLFTWDSANDRWRYITPRYETGTAAAAGTAVTGTLTVWTTGSVPVRAGDEISFGATGRRDISDLWYRIASVTSDTALVLDKNVGTIVDGPYTIRQKFQSANLNNFWRPESVPRGSIGGTVADRWYATNGGIDSIIRYTQGDTQVTRVHLGAGGFKCKTLRRFKNMLLYLNVIENSGAAPNKPQSFKNSDAGLPETMTGGISGEFLVGPKTAPILTAEYIGDDLAVYTENEVVLSTFVGSPDIWAFRTAVSGTGLIAPRLIAPFSNSHRFIARDAAYTFNGMNASEHDSHVWYTVLREQDQNRIHFSHAAFDEENGQLIWSVAKAADTNPSTLPTNLLLYSEHLNSVLWTATNASVTANDTADPLTLTTSADLITENGAAGEHGVHQAVTKAASAVTYTLSAYVSPNTRTRCRLRLGDGTDTDMAHADFLLTGAGSVITSGTTGAGWTVIASAITAIGTFYRVSLVATSDSDTTVRAALRLLDSSAAVSYTGDGASNLWAWGFQLSAGTSVVPYIRSTVLAIGAPSEIGPEFAHEESYLETEPGPVEEDHAYTRRQFPFTTTGFFEREGVLTWADMTQSWEAYNFAWGDRFLSAAFPLILAGDILGRVWQLNTSDTQDGSGYSSFAQFGRRLISDLRSRNLLRRLYILTKRLPTASYDLTVTVSLYDQADSAATVNHIDTFDLALDNNGWMPIYRRGRFAQVQFGTLGSSTGQPWEIYGYDWDVKRGGEG